MNQTRAESIEVGESRATHGPPTDENAHPHVDDGGGVAVVHNGIVENYLALREELTGQGVVFRSQTDTEVLAHLIGRELSGGDDLPGDGLPGDDLVGAVRRALERVQGYYAIAVLSGGPRPVLVCAREGPPLVVAANEEAAWLGSDVFS